MGQRNPHVDAYVAKSAEFARPILQKLRDMILAAGPELSEVIKWGVPHYEFHGLVVGMAAFKHHVSFGFWKSKLMSDPAGLFSGERAGSMCNIKLTSVKELPAAKIIKSYVREAIRLNVEGVKVPNRPRSAQAEVIAPADLQSLFRRHKSAAAAFEAMSNSHRREYVEWIDDAKKPETRARRLEQAISLLSEGKTRNWKYERPAKTKQTRTAR